MSGFLSGAEAGSGQSGKTAYPQRTTRVNGVGPLSQRLDGLGGVRHVCLTMKTATVRDLRNHFPRVAAWIAAGEAVEITRAGKPFARLVPTVSGKPRRFKMPDIRARLERTYGGRVYSTEAVARMRAAELEGEEG